MTRRRLLLVVLILLALLPVCGWAQEDPAPVIPVEMGQPAPADGYWIREERLRELLLEAQEGRLLREEVDLLTQTVSLLEEEVENAKRLQAVTTRVSEIRSASVDACLRGLDECEEAVQSMASLGLDAADDLEKAERQLRWPLRWSWIQVTGGGCYGITGGEISPCVAAGFGFSIGGRTFP